MKLSHLFLIESNGIPCYIDCSQFIRVILATRNAIYIYIYLKWVSWCSSSSNSSSGPLTERNSSIRYSYRKLVSRCSPRLPYSFDVLIIRTVYIFTCRRASRCVASSGRDTSYRKTSLPRTWVQSPSFSLTLTMAQRTRHRRIYR